MVEVQRQEAGIEAQAMEEQGLLACSSCCFLIYLRCTRDGTTQNGLGPPTLIFSQEDAPVDLPSGQSDGDISSTEALSSQMTSACVKLTPDPKIIYPPSP